MRINQYQLSKGKLLEQPGPPSLQRTDSDGKIETWSDLQEVETGQLRQFLAPLDLHPLVLEHCLANTKSPGVISDDNNVLLDFPVSSDRVTSKATYLTLLIQASDLMTIRQAPIPALDDLIRAMCYLSC